jgi:hypothetical protein
MPKYTLQYVCGHSSEDAVSDARIDKIRAQAERSLCPTCLKATRDQITADIDWLLPPLQGTEKQVTWASQLRAKVVTEILDAKSMYEHDEIMSLILADFHHEVIRQSLATWWIEIRKTRVMGLVSEYHSARQSYYRFVLEGRFNQEVEAVIKEFQRAGGEPVDIGAEQAVLGAILVKNDACYCAPFLNPEHFSEDLHKRIYEVAKALIHSGKVATPITLTRFLGDQDVGSITVSRYLARLAAEAVHIGEARGLALKIYALSEYRSRMEAQAQ